MRRLLLFIASLILITGFFLLGPNRSWFKDRIITYYGEFPGQFKRMKEEQRMADRFGNYYTLSRQIARAVNSKIADRNFLLLMPSTSYLKSKGIEYRVPEPVVFYYFTNLRTVWPNSPNASQATWYAHVVNGKIEIDSVQSKEKLQEILAEFNKFAISL
jgi:hypothetical protein